MKFQKKYIKKVILVRLKITNNDLTILNECYSNYCSLNSIKWENNNVQTQIFKL